VTCVTPMPHHMTHHMTRVTPPHPHPVENKNFMPKKILGKKISFPAKKFYCITVINYYITVIKLLHHVYWITVTAFMVIKLLHHSYKKLHHPKFSASCVGNCITVTAFMVIKLQHHSYKKLHHPKLSTSYVCKLCNCITVTVFMVISYCIIVIRNCIIISFLHHICM
jgi:hypothetical protein